MTTFSVGSFSATSSANLRGQSFTPNVPGPDGVGSPGGASPVYLTAFAIGYPSSSTTARATLAFLYTSIPTVHDLNSGVGALAVSTGNTDAADTFGAGTYSRTWTFNHVSLDPATKYYLLFPSSQNLREAPNSPYSGGDAYNTLLAVMTNCTQFQATMSDT